MPSLPFRSQHQLELASHEDKEEEKNSSATLPEGSSTTSSSTSLFSLDEEGKAADGTGCGIGSGGNNSFVNLQWQRAMTLLQSNPSLVTQHILCMTLKHRPPSHVVRIMLELNPQAAAVPAPSASHGSSELVGSAETPLHIAVRYLCSYEVIRLLIQAYPWALLIKARSSTTSSTTTTTTTAVTTTASTKKENDCQDDHDDENAVDTPRSYAKRFRAEETNLIQLLSLPISHWISPHANTNNMTESGNYYNYSDNKISNSSNNNNEKLKDATDDGGGSVDDDDDDDDTTSKDDSTQAATNLSSNSNYKQSLRIETNGIPPKHTPPSPPPRSRLLTPPLFNFCAGPNREGGGSGVAVSSSPTTIPLPIEVPNSSTEASATWRNRRPPPPPTSSSSKVTVASLLASSSVATDASYSASMDTSSTSSINAVRGDFYKKTTYHEFLHPSERHQQQQEQGLLSPMMMNQQDRVELANVKHMCISLVKGHKRLYKQVYNTLPELFQKQIEEQFRIQYTAFDLREQAMRTSFLRRVQDHVLDKVKQELSLESLLEQVQQQQQQQQQDALQLQNKEAHDTQAHALVMVVQEELSRLRLEYQTWQATTVARLDKLEQLQRQVEGHQHQQQQQQQQETFHSNISNTGATASSWEMVPSNNPFSSPFYPFHYYHHPHPHPHPHHPHHYPKAVVGWQPLVSPSFSSPCTVTTSSSSITSSSLPNKNGNKDKQSKNKLKKKTTKKTKTLNSKNYNDEYDEADHYYPIVYFEIANNKFHNNNGFGADGGDTDEVRSLLSEDDVVLYEKRRGWLIPNKRLSMSSLRCIKETVKWFLE